MDNAFPNFKPFELALVIHGMLERDRLVDECAAAGIEFPGERLKSVPPIDLAGALADVFDTLPQKTRQDFIRHFDERTLALRDKIAEWGERRIKTALLEPERFGQKLSPGEVIYALCKDPRPKVSEQAGAFAQVISDVLGARPMKRREKVFNVEIKAPKHLPPEVNDAFNRAIGQIAELRGTVGEIVRVDGRQKERLESLAKQVESLKQDLAARDKKISGLRAELAELAAQKSNLAQEMEIMRAKSDRPAADRDLRKAEYELARAREDLAARDAEIANRAAAIQESALANSQLRLSFEKLQGESAEMRRRLESLNARLVEKPAATQPTPARDPGRVVVLADTHSTYFAARALGLRIDYRVLLEFAVGTGRLGGAVAYVVQRRGSTQSQSFQRALEEFGYQVRARVLEIGVPAEPLTEALSADLRGFAPRAGHIVVFSHNAAIAPVVADAVAQGCRVTVIGLAGEIPPSLAAASTEIIDIATWPGVLLQTQPHL